MTDRVVEHGRRMIRTGSRSFFAAARIFDRPTRESAFLLYAWCRHCDDRIDGQELGHGAAPTGSREGFERLERLERETRRALAGERVDDPVFAGLQRVVTRHQIPEHLPLELLEGFRMDVEGRTCPTLDHALGYCYHVAGVVGVMMGRVMGVVDEDTLDRAADLGLAFQMTNIARDVMDDARAGRVYLPLDWLAEAGVTPARILERRHREAVFDVTHRLLIESERYYRSSRLGIARLGFRHAWAIDSARRIYREIGRRLLERRHSAWDRRLVVGKGRKLRLLVGAAVEAASRPAGRPVAASPRESLWTRPRRGAA